MSNSRKFLEEGFNALDAVQALIEQVFMWGMKPERVLVSEFSVSRGWAFATEYEKKHYILVNEKDFNIALAHLKMTESGDLVDYLYVVPVSYDEFEASKASTGIYKCAYKLI